MAGIGPGYVVTGKGELLNMDDLIVKSSRPLRDKHDHKNKVEKRDAPRVQAINVRGFKPGDGEGIVKVVTPQTAVQPAPVVEAAPEAAIPVDERPIPSAFAGGEARSLADLTGVKLDEPRRLKKKPESATRASSDALKEVLTGLHEAAVDRGEPEADWRKPGR